MKAKSNAGKERMPVSCRVGLVLKQLREAMGIRQETVASRACLSVVGLSRLENGLACSSADNYEREAVALGLDYDLVVALAAALARRGEERLTPLEIALALTKRHL